MKRPTARQARAICNSLDARAVLVIAISKDNRMEASYWETKQTHMAADLRGKFAKMDMDEGRQGNRRRV